jgi:hypothetical protein
MGSMEGMMEGGFGGGSTSKLTTTKHPQQIQKQVQKKRGVRIILRGLPVRCQKGCLLGETAAQACPKEEARFPH